MIAAAALLVGILLSVLLPRHFRPGPEASPGLTTLGAPAVSDPKTGAANPETGFRTVLIDGEDLFSPEEESLLLQEMEPVTRYGHAAVVTGYAGKGTSTSDYARSSYRELFGSDSGTLFLIDMGNRNIWIYSYGYNYRIITKAYANIITDNIYRYATQGEYYASASEAFAQIRTLLDGGRIAMPMKYIGNALTALILGFLITYLRLLFLRIEACRLRDALRKELPDFAFLRGPGDGGIEKERAEGRFLLSEKLRK